jgi:chemotaxis protein MotB
MAEKKHQEEDRGESAPLWIISFADLVTLMLSFFVILAAGNPQDVKADPDFAEIIAAVKQAFRYLPPADSNDPVDIQILMNKLKGQKGRGGEGKRGDAFQDNEGAIGRYDQVTTVRTGTQVTMGGQVPFDKESARLNEEAVLKLKQVAARVKGHTNIFVIKGHTSRDEEQALAGTGRDLAYERACAAASKLASLGLTQESLRVQSCRDYEPLKVGAYSEAEQALNRRVELIATESLISEVRGPKGDTGQKSTAYTPASQASPTSARQDQPSPGTQLPDGARGADNIQG